MPAQRLPGADQTPGVNLTAGTAHPDHLLTEREEESRQAQPVVALGTPPAVPPPPRNPWCFFSGYPQAPWQPPV